MQKVLTDITGQETAVRPKGRPDYDGAKEQFEALRRLGRPADWVVQEFAATGKVDETIAALAILCRAPIELVENAMDRPARRQRPDAAAGQSIWAVVGSGQAGLPLARGAGRFVAARLSMSCTKASNGYSRRPRKP